MSTLSSVYCVLVTDPYTRKDVRTSVSPEAAVRQRRSRNPRSSSNNRASEDKDLDVLCVSSEDERAVDAVRVPASGKAGGSETTSRRKVRHLLDAVEVPLRLRSPEKQESESEAESQMEEVRSSSLEFGPVSAPAPSMRPKPTSFTLYNGPPLGQTSSTNASSGTSAAQPTVSGP